MLKFPSVASELGDFHPSFLASRRRLTRMRINVISDIRTAELGTVNGSTVVEPKQLRNDLTAEKFS
jgi:hypothetical protein